MKYEELLLKGIKIGVFAILFTPLILGAIGLTLSAYPKAVFFRTLIEITFIFYLLLVFFNSRYFPKISPLLLVVFGFVGILILTSLTGINPYRSFFGDPERAEGVILHLHLLAFFLIIISVFNKKKEWLELFKIAVLVSGFSGLAGILQKFDISSFYGVALPSRISGTLSNPDFFGPYIVLAIFLGLFVFLLEEERKWKIVWKSILILNCLTLFLSGTRGAWVGFGVGVAFLFCFWFFRYSNLRPVKSAKGGVPLGQFNRVNQKKRKIILFGILFLTIFVFLITLNQERIGLEENFFFQRFYSFFNPLESLASRIDVWEIAVNAWKEKPILGWGPESFSFVFDKYFKADYLQHIPESMYFDYPHNKVMELMAGTGLLGTLCYFSIFVVLFYLIFRYIKSSEENKSSILGLILAAFFISYFVQNLLIFDTISAYLLFFLVLGFVNNNFLPINKKRLRLNLKRYVGKKTKFFFITPLILLSLISFYHINYKPTVAVMAFPGSVAYEQDYPHLALSGYKEALNKNTIYDKDFQWVLVERLILILEMGRAKDVEEEFIKTLSDLRPLLEKDLEKPDRRPVDYYRYLARINERIYLFSKDPVFLVAMEEIAKKGLDFNNQKPQFYRLIGRKKILENNYEDGERFFQKASTLLPDSFGNTTSFHRYLGSAYYKAGNKQKAAEEFKKVVDRNYYWKKFGPKPLKKQKILPKDTQAAVSFVEGVAVLFCRGLQDFETGFQIYKRAIEVYPEHETNLRANLEVLTEEYKSKEP